MIKSKFTIEIENKLVKAVPKKFAGKLTAEYFLKGKGAEVSRLRFLNLTIPEIKHQLATLFSTTEESYSASLFADMESLWFESEIFDAKTFAVYWLDKQKPEFLIKNHKKILSWSNEIDNWAHADGLCSIYARMFEQMPKLILPTYLKWNRHKNSWLRRCSMVGLFYYSRARTNQPSFNLAKKLVNPHFSAPEYYVQKAVGWTIREMYNTYPPETIQYIENNNHQLSSVAWVAASEKLPAKLKKSILTKRRFLRSKKG
ncbi:MAG: DNA alkylation repair protein [Bdellovibrionota bacterium]